MARVSEIVVARGITADTALRLARYFQHERSSSTPDAADVGPVALTGAPVTPSSVITGILVGVGLKDGVMVAVGDRCHSR